MDYYTSAEKAAQIITAATQADDVTDLLDELAAEGDPAVLLIVSMLCSRMIRVFDAHMLEEHGERIDVGELVGEAVREIVNAPQDGPHPDIG